MSNSLALSSSTKESDRTVLCAPEHNNDSTRVLYFADSSKLNTASTQPVRFEQSAPLSRSSPQKLLGKTRRVANDR